MNGVKSILFLVVCIFAFAETAHCGQDMREMEIEARQKRQLLLEQSRLEREAAQQEAARTRQKIIRDRETLQESIAELEQENQEYESAVSDLETELQGLQEKEDELQQELAEAEDTVHELLGAIQTNAQDVEGLLQDSLQDELDPEQQSALGAISEEEDFAGMQDLHMMADILHDEIRLSGAVRVQEGRIVDRTGEETTAEVLYIGNFSAAYRTQEETGFLQLSPEGGQLFALSSLPSWRMQNRIESYMDGQSQAVPVDISRGGALQQLSHELSIREQIFQGGPIVWPILFIFGLGLFIIAERMVFLLRKRFDSQGFMGAIEQSMQQGDLEKCKESCAGHAHKPLPRIVKAGLNCCHMSREEMENALQEAILREIPAMERFLSTLGMLAAIAPLLGLLGTVTGMINTFHVITMHGTGDPSMMSGGISEALVTTMLGLSVAIPMLMAHTWLNRAVEKNIGDMEEKAVSLVNIAHKNREAEHRFQSEET